MPRKQGLKNFISVDSVRKISRKGLIKKNWELCRLIKFELVGRQCEVCGSKVGLEVDHCFSRNDKKLYYEIRNLTVLCSSCHSHKTYRRKSMDLRVYELVERREGGLAFAHMRCIDEGMTALREWQDKWYHEEWNEKLTEHLNAVKNSPR